MNNNNQSTVGTGQCPVPTINIQNNHYGLLSKIINGFKNVSTKTIRKQTHSFHWQRSYYDHIIRNEESLQNIRQYIKNNPLKWSEDRENPKNIKHDNQVYPRLYQRFLKDPKNKYQ